MRTPQLSQGKGIKLKLLELHVNLNCGRTFLALCSLTQLPSGNREIRFTLIHGKNLQKAHSAFWRRHRKAHPSLSCCEDGCRQAIEKANRNICLHMWNTSLRTFLLHYSFLQQTFIVYLLHIWFCSRHWMEGGEFTWVSVLTKLPLVINK